MSKRFSVEEIALLRFAAAKYEEIKSYVFFYPLSYYRKDVRNLVRD